MFPNLQGLEKKVEKIFVTLGHYYQILCQQMFFTSPTSAKLELFGNANLVGLKKIKN
jgi:hypothetical protein